MFAIYDINGRRFRDTLERLHKVQAVSSNRPDRQIRSNLLRMTFNSYPAVKMPSGQFQIKRAKVTGK